MHGQLDALARGNLDLGRLEAMVLDHEQDIRLGGMGSSAQQGACSKRDSKGTKTSEHVQILQQLAHLNANHSQLQRMAEDRQLLPLG
jgi:hypothetical protein